MDSDPMSVDLLEEIRAALDGLESILLGRVIDIEMSRLRVLTDPMLFRKIFAELIKFAVARSESPTPITVRVTRTGKVAWIEIVNEGDSVTRDDLPDLTSVREELRGMGGEIGTPAPGDTVAGWMTLPIATGAASAADA